MENINHRNFYKKTNKVEIIDEPVIDVPVEDVPVEDVPVKVDEPVVDTPVTDDEILSKADSVDDLYKLIKSEQIEKLVELGLTKKEAKKLKLEKDRVEKILELM